MVQARHFLVHNIIDIHNKIIRSSINNKSIGGQLLFFLFHPHTDRGASAPSHLDPADSVGHAHAEMPRPEVELMTDAALCAAVPDRRRPLVPAPALLPCADVGILDERHQLRWVVAVAKPVPARNDVEVFLDQGAQPRHAAVLPPASRRRRRAVADLLEEHPRLGVRGVGTVLQHRHEVTCVGVPKLGGLVDKRQPDDGSVRLRHQAHHPLVAQGLHMIGEAEALLEEQPDVPRITLPEQVVTNRTERQALEHRGVVADAPEDGADPTKVQVLMRAPNDDANDDLGDHFFWQRHQERHYGDTRTAISLCSRLR